MHYSLSLCRQSKVKNKGFFLHIALSNTLHCNITLLNLFVFPRIALNSKFSFVLLSVQQKGFHKSRALFVLSWLLSSSCSHPSIEQTPWLSVIHSYIGCGNKLSFSGLCFFSLSVSSFTVVWKLVLRNTYLIWFKSRFFI